MKSTILFLVSIAGVKLSSMVMDKIIKKLKMQLAKKQIVEYIEFLGFRHEGGFDTYYYMRETALTVSFKVDGTLHKKMKSHLVFQMNIEFFTRILSLNQHSKIFS